jgi:NitT/TauT family transport system substrate-binding protein
MKRWFKLLALSVAVPSLLIACAPAAAPAAKPPAQPSGPTAAASQPTAAVAKPAGAPPAPAEQLQPLSPPITISIGGSVPDLPYGTIVAIERGYFRDVGIELDVKGRLGDSAATMTMAASNHVDVAYAATGPAVFNTTGRGIDLRLVAAGLETFAGEKSLCWVARKELTASGQVKNGGDFRGRKVGGQGMFVSPTDIFLTRALAPYGLTMADVDAIALSFGEVNAAMGNAAVDIAWINEPLMTQGIDQGLYDKLVCLGDLYPGYQTTFLAYSPSFLVNTQAARNFIYAHLKGTRDYADGIFRNRGTDEIIGILAKETMLKDAAIWKRIANSWFSPTGYVNINILAADQDFYIANGQLTQATDLNKLVDNSFNEWANRLLGGYDFKP